MIKFPCPQCNQVIEAPDGALDQAVTCPACGTTFEPATLIPSEIDRLRNDTPASHLAGLEAERREMDAALTRRRVSKRQFQLRQSARAFYLLAAITLIISGVNSIAGLQAVRVDSLRADGVTEAASYFHSAGRFFLFTCWLYLFAQLAHIRANTEH